MGYFKDAYDVSKDPCSDDVVYSFFGMMVIISPFMVPVYYFGKAAEVLLYYFGKMADKVVQ